MIYDNMEFHNVAELEKRDLLPGLILSRVPKEIRSQMGSKGYEKGRVVSQYLIYKKQMRTFL